MQSNNKRIAKNAITLTLRSILVAIVGLYTSRVVLESLGVEDYGIYGVIGGIIGMASFLNTSMAGATSRFITFEMGRVKGTDLSQIFSTAFRIHLIIAFLVMFFGETVGLWFLNHKMNIPEGKIFDANFLYQLTVFSVLIGFTQVPYNAAIIAHEKMNIYAYYEIIFIVLKLLIVYILFLTPKNRLIIYSILLFAVSILNAAFYRGYCIRHFQETQNLRSFDKGYARKMLSFSGFDLYGNMCVVAQRQGQPIILNFFFGVIANAGASIASTVISTLTNFIITIVQAFKPQIIKNYASEQISQMSLLMMRCLSFTLLTYGILAIPFFIVCPHIIYLWLGQIPPYCVIFIRLILIVQMLDIVVTVNNISIHATGNIKRLSFINGSFYLLSPILSYIWLKLGGAAQSIYVVNIILSVCIVSYGLYLVGNQVSFKLCFRQLVTVLKNIVLLIFCCVFLSMISNHALNFTNIGIEQDNKMHLLLRILIISAINLIIVTSLYSAFILNKTERQIILIKLKDLVRLAK